MIKCHSITSRNIHVFSHLIIYIYFFKCVVECFWRKRFTFTLILETSQRFIFDIFIYSFAYHHKVFRYRRVFCPVVFALEGRGGERRERSIQYNGDRMWVLVALSDVTRTGRGGEDRPNAHIGREGVVALRNVNAKQGHAFVNKCRDL